MSWISQKVMSNLLMIHNCCTRAIEQHKLHLTCRLLCRPVSAAFLEYTTVVEFVYGPSDRVGEPCTHHVQWYELPQDLWWRCMVFYHKLTHLHLQWALLPTYRLQTLTPRLLQVEIRKKMAELHSKSPEHWRIYRSLCHTLNIKHYWWGYALCRC